MDRQDNALALGMAIATEKALGRPSRRKTYGLEPTNQFRRRRRPETFVVRHVAPEPHSACHDVRWTQAFQSHTKRGSGLFPHLLTRASVVRVADTVLNVVAERDGIKEIAPALLCRRASFRSQNRVDDLCKDSTVTFSAVLFDYTLRGLSTPIATPIFSVFTLQVVVVAFAEDQETGRQT